MGCGRSHKIPENNTIYIETKTTSIGPKCQYRVPAMTEVILKKGYSPFINELTGTWFQYDDQLRAFVDTGVSASSQTPIEEDEINILWEEPIGEED